MLLNTVLGTLDGMKLVITIGTADGILLGDSERVIGIALGIKDSTLLGRMDGPLLGRSDSIKLGNILGNNDGCELGTRLSSLEGIGLGMFDGTSVVIMLGNDDE